MILYYFLISISFIFFLVSLISGFILFYIVTSFSIFIYRQEIKKYKAKCILQKADVLLLLENLDKSRADWEYKEVLLNKLFNAIRGPGSEKTALFVFHRFFFDRYRHKSNHGVNIFSWPRNWQSSLLHDYVELNFPDLDLLIIFGWIKKFNLVRFFLKRYIYYRKIFIKEFNLSELNLKRLFLIKFYNINLRKKSFNISNNIWKILDNTLFKEISSIFNVLENKLKILDLSFFKNINKNLKYGRKKILSSDWPFLVCYLHYQEALVIDEILDYFSNEYVIPLSKGILLPSKVLIQYLDWETEIKKKIESKFNFSIVVIEKLMNEFVVEKNELESSIILDSEFSSSLVDIQNIYCSRGDGKQWYYYKTLVSGKRKRISKFIFNEFKKLGCLEVEHEPRKLPIPDESRYYILGYKYDDPTTITNIWQTNNYYFQRQKSGRTKRISKGAYRLLDREGVRYGFLNSNKDISPTCEYNKCWKVAKYTQPYINKRFKKTRLFCKKHWNFFKSVLKKNKDRLNEKNYKISMPLSVDIYYIVMSRKGYFFKYLKTGNKKRISEREYNILLRLDVKILYLIRTCNAVLDSGVKCAKHIKRFNGYLCPIHERKRERLTLNNSIVIKNNFKYLSKINYWKFCENLEYFLWKEFVIKIKNIF